MKKLVLSYTLIAVLAWAVGIALDPPEMNGRAISHEVYYLTGIIAWGLMAICIVIAARPSWIEKLTKTPIDQLYRSHRTIGFWALGLSVAHWLARYLAAPFMSLLTLEPVPKIARGELVGFDAFWSWLRSFSVVSSDWFTGLALVLGALVFVTSLNYTRWLKLHRLFSVVFIVLAVHCLRLMDAGDVLQPYGILNILTTVVGCWYSVKLLVFGAGYELTTKAAIESVDVKNGLTIITVKPEKNMKVAPGEFVFFKTANEEKHPFSVARQHADGSITLIVKALGDYTSTSVPKLTPGDVALIEGPWGHFRPSNLMKDEVWIAAGVGIAPFLAWLGEAACKRAKQVELGPDNVKLIWCVKRAEEEPLLEKATVLAKEAGVELEVFESKGTRFDPKRFFNSVHPKSIALCAGGKLAETVREAYLAAGGSADRIRQEHFVWR